MQQATSSAPTFAPDYPFASSPFKGIALITSAKVGDIATTLLVMGTPGIEEQNPLAQAGFATAGVYPTLLIGGIGMVLFVTAVTELAVRYLDRRTDTPTWGVSATRLVGYGLPAVLTALVALNNLLMSIGRGVAV